MGMEYSSTVRHFSKFWTVRASGSCRSASLRLAGDVRFVHERGRTAFRESNHVGCDFFPSCAPSTVRPMNPSRLSFFSI